MIYGSVCSGIEAATVAWHPLGWRPAFFAEIDKFPSAVLRRHYPTVPNHGDFTTIQSGDYEPIDLLVGGTPCQDFSVAGLRAGLGGERGNLTLEYLRLAQRLRPRWLVWENVPGVLSATSNDAPDHSDDGEGRWEDDANERHAFACFLAGLQELGYGFAYRVLDAQYFGVPQRRRRVFVVGHLGDWRRAAAVLFERHSLSGDTAPRRQAGERVADSLTVGANQCSGFAGDFTHDLSPALTSSGRGVSRSGDSRGQDPVVAVNRRDWPVDVAPTLGADFGQNYGFDDQHVYGGGDCLSGSHRQVGERNWRTCGQRMPESHCDGGVFDDVPARRFL